MSNPPPNLNMKAKSALSTHLWLVLSLVANFFLVIFLYIAMDPLRLPPPPPSRVEGDLLVKTNVVVRHENFTWGEVESTNYVTLIKNLRAIGCPEPTIRDIIMPDLDRLYAKRRLTEVVYPNYQWWRSEPEPSVVKAAAEKLAEIESNRRTVLTSLLGQGWDVQGNEAVAARGGITLTGPILGDLPQETKDSVYAIAARTQLKIEAYQNDQQGQGKTMDPMELVRLREEPLAQLVPVLNPAQLLEYELRYSPSAQQLRLELRTISLTPDQFRGLFNAVNSVNSQPVFYYAGKDPDLLSQQQQLRAQNDAIIKSVLGDQAYAAYQLELDPLYQGAQTMASQLGVGTNLVNSIYEISRATETELTRIRKDTTLSNDEKVEAISQTRMEEEQSFQQLLGPTVFQHWLQLH